MTWSEQKISNSDWFELVKKCGRYKKKTKKKSWLLFGNLETNVALRISGFDALMKKICGRNKGKKQGHNKGRKKASK